MRRTALAAALGAVLALAPAASAATAVTVGKSCYAEGDQISIRGSGFTPGGGVDLTLERGATVLERSSSPRAEPDGEEPPDGPDGTLSGRYGLDVETGFFQGIETRFDMTLRLVDRTRRDAGQPLESPEVTATTTFIFSRWNVGIRGPGGRVHPSRPLGINAVGYTNAIGRRLYVHYVRNGRRVHTRRLGILRGPCGDMRARLSRGFPFRPVAAGRWSVVFNSSRRNHRAVDSVSHRTRVRRRIP